MVFLPCSATPREKTLKFTHHPGARIVKGNYFPYTPQRSPRCLAKKVAVSGAITLSASAKFQSSLFAKISASCARRVSFFYISPGRAQNKRSTYYKKQKKSGSIVKEG
jgi:hypothetical protein